MEEDSVDVDDSVEVDSVGFSLVSKENSGEILDAGDTAIGDGTKAIALLL